MNDSTKNHCWLQTKLSIFFSAGVPFFILPRGISMIHTQYIPVYLIFFPHISAWRVRFSLKQLSI